MFWNALIFPFSAKIASPPRTLQTVRIPESMPQIETAPPHTVWQMFFGRRQNGADYRNSGTIDAKDRFRMLQLETKIGVHSKYVQSIISISHEANIYIYL
jgi:hypothetical protein